MVVRVVMRVVSWVVVGLGGMWWWCGLVGGGGGGVPGVWVVMRV